MMWRVYDLVTTLGGGTTYATFILALQALTTANFNVTAFTGTITAVSANGRSVNLGAGGVSSSPEDYGACVGCLRDLYVSVRAVLISSGVAVPTDAQIFTEMMDRPELQSIVEVGASYAGLRYG